MGPEAKITDWLISETPTKAERRTLHEANRRQKQAVIEAQRRATKAERRTLHEANRRQKEQVLGRAQTRDAAFPYRVRLLQKKDGSYVPAPIRLIREQRTPRVSPNVERSEAQRLIAERGSRIEAQEAAMYPEFLSSFETILEYIKSFRRGTREEAHRYCLSTRGANGSSPDLQEVATEILKGTNPIYNMANYPLDYLSQPTVFSDQGGWAEIKHLHTAAHPFHGYKGALVYPSSRAPKEDHLFFSEALKRWVTIGRFESETIITLVRSLARIRDADCTYFSRMFFPGDTPPETFISNLSILYEKTADDLGTANPRMKTIVTALKEEARLLSVVQAQNYEFVTYGRPTDYRVTLLPVAVYLAQAIKEDLRKGRMVDYGAYADKVMGAFRSRRCGLGKEEIFAICSFLSGKIPNQEITAPDGHHQIPWIVLDQIKRGVPSEKRLFEFRQVPATRSLGRLCSALASLTLEPSITTPVVPDLLLAFRKIGYLRDISQQDYQDLGLSEETWENHQKAMTEEKKSLTIRPGDIVVFVPLSGWSITNAHFEMARAARYIAPQMIRRLEIKWGQPLKERGVKVVFTFGMFAQKAAEGMPEVRKRSALGEAALAREDNLYVASAGIIDDHQERSDRIKQLMTQYERRFGISWSLPGQGREYPGEGCIPVIVGGTEKLGRDPDGSRSTKYRYQESSPTENVEFLNSLPQIFALLEPDIDQPSVMARFVYGLMRNFNGGIAIIATHFPELHSTLAVQYAIQHWKAVEASDIITARKLRLAFDTMIPPSIRDQAWKMIVERAAQTQGWTDEVIERVYTLGLLSS